MRTKTLLLSVALGAASIAAVMAQTTPVYSVNIVGYVNKQVPAGFSLIANPLVTGANKGNKLIDVLPTAPDGAVVYKWLNASGKFQDGITYFLGDWSKVNDTDSDVLAPGEGAFLYIDPTTVTPGQMTTLTFVGEVKTGDTSIAINKGFNLLANPVPQAVDLSTVSFPAGDGDYILFWNSTTQKYTDAVTYFAGSWDGPVVPEIAGGFFVYKDPEFGTAQTWTRTFNVN